MAVMAGAVTGWLAFIALCLTAGIQPAQGTFTIVEAWAHTVMMILICGHMINLRAKLRK